MIQDIAPHNLDIVYRDELPNSKSRIIFMSGNKIYVKENNTEIDFPMYIDTNLFGHDIQYLFLLDGTSYFRCHIEKMEQLQTLYAAGDGTWKTRHELRVSRPKELTFVALTAMHLDGWYEKNKYCGACGAKTVYDKKERMLRCPCCNNMIYPRINPAVIVAVTNGDKLLLTKYRDREYKKYALVAGFTEIGESFEETVRREVMEETGLKVKNIRYYKSQPWALSDNILAGYFCEVDGDTDIKMDKDELSVAEWVAKEDIPNIIEELSLTNEMIQKFIVDKAL
ncbi:MAG: NAD(+) diphosphatase [Agathobacter sp.]|nr:NAD(+) diphosphatase [Agathobacter sp.]